MSTDRHPDILPLLADFVLGELSMVDRRRVEAHATTCAACATELRELALAFHGIGLSEEPVPPPAHLRARVLDSLRADAHSGPMRTRARRHDGAWLALAATIALVLGASLYLDRHRNAELRERVRRAEAVSAELQDRLGAHDAQADLAVTILTAPDMNRIDLAGSDASRAAVARAYWSPSKGLLIVADRLPDPPPGRVYQVWLIGSRSTGPVSAGLLGNPRSGRGMLIVPAPPGVSGRVTVAVTDEPPGGRPAPSGGKHLAGS